MFEWLSGRWPRLSVPLVAFSVVEVVYLLTHPFPALNGGVYMKMARTIMENGYAFPAVIPHITTDGIPFGFSPLGFYLAAFLLEFGVSTLTITRLVPAIPFILALVAFFAFADDLLDDQWMATLATVVIATSAPVLQYTISAGGFVRATALLFTVLGLHTGLQAFTTETWGWRWVAVSTLLVGLTALTHPKYFLFLGTSLLALLAAFDRTRRGVWKGIFMLGGGVLLAAPWWAQVIATHGVGLFLEASQTHGGIGNPFWFFGFLLPIASVTVVWPALVIISGIYLVAQGRFFLPGWMLALGVVVGNDEYAMVVGALMIATLLHESVVPAIRSDRLPARLGLPWSLRGRTVTQASLTATFFAVVLVTYATGSAVLYVEDGLLTDDEFISFVDDDDLEGMEWAKRNTDTDATFVVVGDAAEWFPLFAERTSVVAARGSAWEGPGERRRMLGLRVALSGCLSAACMTETIEDIGEEPDYLYVSRDGYIRGNNRHLINKRWITLPPNLNESSKYSLEYGNSDVLIYRYGGGTPS